MVGNDYCYSDSYDNSVAVQMQALRVRLEQQRCKMYNNYYLTKRKKFYYVMRRTRRRDESNELLSISN